MNKELYNRILKTSESYVSMLQARIEKLSKYEEDRSAEELFTTEGWDKLNLEIEDGMRIMNHITQIMERADRMQCGDLHTATDGMISDLPNRLIRTDKQRTN